MTDLADLEAEMADEAYLDDRTRHARERVAQTGRQQILARPDPEQHANALRTYQLHGTPALHDWLLALENECIDLLLPEDQDRFRRRQ